MMADGKTKNGRWLWFASAVLLPVAVMIYFYRRNVSYVNFAGVLIACGAAAAGSALIWLGIAALFRSPVSAFGACLVGWIGCLATNAICSFFLRLNIMNGILKIIAACTFFLMLLTAYLLRRTKKIGGRIYGLGVFVFVCLLLAMNGIPVAVNRIKTVANGDPEAYVRKEFFVESGLEQPNVYWFHCDGMLGFRAMRAYFCDGQEELSAALVARGFAINEDATFESGHTTQIAVPALMCPDAYDGWIAQRLATHKDAMELRSASDVYDKMLRVRLHNELIAAFGASAYSTQLSTYLEFYPPVADENYICNAFDTYIAGKDSTFYVYWTLNRDNVLEYLDSISHLLCRAAELFGKLVPDGMFREQADAGMRTKIRTDVTQQEIDACFLRASDQRSGDVYRSRYEDGIVLMLDDCTKHASPHFSIFFSDIAHSPFYCDENGNVIGGTEDRPESRLIANYPAQHKCAAKVLLNKIDLILESDPDAVIVLQADHGLHVNTEDEFYAAFGAADASIDMWNNVFSAIRVPEKYQNGDEHYALANPLNMSRYLVNSFVGKNYAYLK